MMARVQVLRCGSDPNVLTMVDNGTTKTRRRPPATHICREDNNVSAKSTHPHTISLA